MKHKFSVNEVAYITHGVGIIRGHKDESLADTAARLLLTLKEKGLV